MLCRTYIAGSVVYYLQGVNKVRRHSSITYNFRMKSESFTEKERSSYCEQLLKI